MSSPIASEGGDVALETLVHCLTNQRIGMSIEVASTALIYYDWLLTSSDEWEWLLRRGRSIYARVLFLLARYPALTSACVGLLPLTIALRNTTTYLSVITIISSELVLAMRTWAIWQNSLPMLVFLVVLTIVCAAPAIAIIERDMATTVVVPDASWNEMQKCQVLMSAVKRAWAVPYISIMMFEAVVLALTLYKAILCKKVSRTQNSKLLDVLWIDGVIYFVFMFLIGTLNVGLALHVSDSQLRVACEQFQTASHSILSTRIVLHTGRVLRQGTVDREVPECSRRSESVELERLIHEGT